MATGILKNKHNEQEGGKDYRKLVSQQKDLLAYLNREINVAESRILESLKVPGGIFKNQGKYRRYRKQIRILENKYNKERVTFDELQWSNRNNRRDIVYLQKLSHIVCNIEETFNRQIAREQNTLEQLEERLNLTINQRSEAETRMLEAKEDIEAETFHFTKTLMQLNNVIKHDVKVNTFIKTKFSEESPSGDDEDSMKRGKQQHHQNEVTMLEMDMQGYSALLEVTGERDLHRIGHMFIQNEQQNFGHFKYINELHDKRSALRKSTEKMKSEIMSLQQENKGHDEQGESQLKDLESELERQSCLADSLEKQCAALQATLDQLKTAFNSFLDEIMPEAATATLDDIAHLTSILEGSIGDLMIQANNVEDEEKELELLQLANFDLLPECKAAVPERSRSTSRSLKSA